MRRAYSLLSGLGLSSVLFFSPLAVNAQATGVFWIVGLPANDGGLFVLRLLQIVLILALLAGVGMVGYGLYLKQSEESSEELSKRWLVIGGAVGSSALLLLVIVSVIYSSLAKKYKATGPDVTSSVETPQESARRLESKNARRSKVASHYPQRDEKNVARNASILITFTEPVLPESMHLADKKIKKSSVKIVPASGGEPIDAIIDFADDAHTIVRITPLSYMGVANKKTRYSVALTNKLQKENGQALFERTSGYAWSFEVSGIIDTTPPQIESFLPLSSKKQPEKIPHNSLVQLTFTEPIDPSVIKGDKFLITQGETKKKVTGGVVIGNGYRTITFYSDTQCGIKNTCDEAMVCLPFDTRIGVVVKAATMQETRTKENPYRAKFPYDGVVDVSGNSFDGGSEYAEKKNGKAEGSPLDDFSFSFDTSNLRELSVPTILAVNPSRDAVGIDVKQPIDVTFSHFMDATSIHTWSLTLGEDVELNYWMNSRHDIGKRNTLIRIDHDAFLVNTYYSPEVRSEVKDIFQNCYNASTGPIPAMQK